MTKTHRGFKAFTIVELLVVVSVMALLMAFLLPSLSKAREVAVRMKCLAYERGIGLQSGVYANDYKAYLPTGDDAIYNIHNTTCGTDFCLTVTTAGPTNPVLQVNGTGRLLLGDYLQLRDVWCPSLKSTWPFSSATWCWDVQGPSANWPYAQNFVVGYDYRSEGSNKSEVSQGINKTHFLSPDRDPLLAKVPILWDDVSGGTTPWMLNPPVPTTANMSTWAHADGFNVLNGDLSARWRSDPNWESMRTIGLNDFANGSHRDVWVWGFLDQQ